jgi:hypothetical protein
MALHQVIVQCRIDSAQPDRWILIEIPETNISRWVNDLLQLWIENRPLQFNENGVCFGNLTTSQQEKIKNLGYLPTSEPEKIQKIGPGGLNYYVPFLYRFVPYQNDSVENYCYSSNGYYGPYKKSHRITLS